MKPLPGWMLLVVGGLCFALAFGDKGCTLSPSADVAAFSADKPCVMVSGDLAMQGDQSLGKTHPGVISAVVTWAKKNGAEYFLDDVNQKTAPTNEAQWVQDGWKVADRAHPPSIVGANKSKGIKPQPLPNKPDDVTKLLDKLK